MMHIKDNTNTIWIVGAVILANMYFIHNNIYGFFLWIGFAFLILIIDLLRINAELKMIERRMRYLNHIHQIEAQKLVNKKPKRQGKK
jgi:hypothetical protein